MSRLIIFDLDGTILDTIADLSAGVNHTLEIHGFPTHTMSEFKMMVGHGMRKLVTAAMPESERREDFIDTFLKEFLDYYLEHIDIATVPFPGIPELLRKLDAEGFKIAVASNKIQPGTERLIREFFPDIPFVAICGNRPGYPLKPDPALVRSIMDAAGVCGSDTIMVGDSDTDIQTAKNAGIRVIAVTWGLRPAEALTGADVIANTAEELLDACRI